MSPIRIGGLVATLLLIPAVVLISPTDAYPQPKPPAEETDNVVPVAASVQVVRNEELTLGSDKMKVSSIEYAQQGTTVYLLPVWLVARVEMYNAADNRWEELPPRTPLPTKTEATAPRLRVQLANLLAQANTRDAVEQRLREHVARSEGVKPEQIKLRSPTFNPRGFRITLAAPGSTGDAGEVSLSRTVIVPPAVAEDNGRVFFDLLPENIAGLQAANAEPVLLRDTYLKLSGQMKARFEKQQYLANFQVVQTAITSLQNELQSIQPTGQPSPEVFVQVPVGGSVEGKAAVTAAFSQYLVGSISVREGANVNPGVVNELAERILARMLSQIALAQEGDARRAAVMLGNMATLSATVGEIKTLARQKRAEREEQLKAALDHMDAYRTGQKSEYKGSVGVHYGIIGGKVEGAYAKATEDEKATRRKQEVETLHRGLDELAKHFDGRLPTLTGIRFDQKALDESLKVVQVELQQNSFTIGWSQHDWKGIKLTTTAGLAVSPELLLRQVEQAQARYADFEKLLGSPEKVKELQEEYLREARAAMEQAKATADRVAEMEKRRMPAEVERRLKKLELRISATLDDGTRFATLPKGTFWMGGGGGKPGEKEVSVEAFQIGIHAVTQRQWEAVMGNNPSHFSRDGAGKDAVKDITDADLEQFPVENVCWDDPKNTKFSVKEFIRKLNAEEKAKGSEWTYRLPTEAEWEYACRGGATSKEDCSFHFYFAEPTNDLSSADANFDSRSPVGKGAKTEDYLKRPVKVGSYKPNKLGIYDMHGNVWQWCEDSYDGGAARVIRGGSWVSSGVFCRAAYRDGDGPAGRSSNLGFRLARVSSR